MGVDGPGHCRQSAVHHHPYLNAVFTGKRSRKRSVVVCEKPKFNKTIIIITQFSFSMSSSIETSATIPEGA